MSLCNSFFIVYSTTPYHAEMNYDRNRMRTIEGTVFSLSKAEMVWTPGEDGGRRKTKTDTGNRD